MIKTIIIHAIFFCTIVCPVAYSDDDSRGTPAEVEILKPTIISTSHYDIDHDGKNEIIEIIMEKGKKINSEDPWCGGGERWEGNFSIQVRKGAKVLSKRSLNEIMVHQKIGVHNGREVIETRSNNELLSFWHPTFTLVFRDYNNDGQIDFNLGQYSGCTGSDYWLFTIANNGAVKPLIVDGLIHAFYVSDPRHFNSINEPILEPDKGLFKYSIFDRDEEIEYSTWYKWDGKQFVTAKHKKESFKRQFEAFKDDMEAVVLKADGNYSIQSKYQDDSIAFYYPENWELTSVKGHGLKIKLRPKDKSQTKESMESLDEEIVLYISLSSESFEKVAKAAGFKIEGQKWSIEGRHGAKGEVEEIKGKNWKGLLGEAPIGIFKKAGGYAGLGFAMTAIITNGSASTVISGNALGYIEGNAILNSIEFIGNIGK